MKKERTKLDIAISIANCNTIIKESKDKKEILLASFLKLKFIKEKGDIK
jgi:hypothetical protein